MGKTAYLFNTFGNGVENSVKAAWKFTMKTEVDGLQFQMELFKKLRQYCLKIGESPFTGTTVNSDRYCDTVRKLRRAIQNRRRGKLSSGVRLLHDNARPHVSRETQELLTNIGWTVVPHPPYSPDLAPSDYHLFPKLKEQ
ncbi:hypothetical protein J6590_108589 [Homalodisca vitripennis]|nr:hypothetical protein J6590_108589 [Homalodisca vitripennis]